MTQEQEQDLNWYIQKILDGDIRLKLRNHTPTNAGDTGTQWEVAIDADFIYICVATDSWKRVAIAAW